MKFILPILILFCNYSNAQKSNWEKLIDDPNIVWVADFEQDYCFKPLEKILLISHHQWDASDTRHEGFSYSDSLLKIQAWNKLNIRKVPVPSEKNGFSVEYGGLADFWSNIVKSQFSGSCKNGYADSYLVHNLDAVVAQGKTGYFLKTINYLDSETYKEKVETVVGRLDYDWIVGIRALHRVYLDKNTSQIGLEVISWTPLIHFPYPGRLDVHRPTIWFEAQKSKNTDKELLNFSDITWAFETHTQSNAPLLDTLVPIKGKLDAMAHVTDLLKNHSIELISTIGYEKSLSQNEIDYLTLGGQDTITIVDPETYDEKYEFVQTNPVSKIAQLQFIIRWYWDDKKKMLLYRNVGYAPTTNWLDPDGRIRYSMPLFYVPIK